MASRTSTYAQTSIDHELSKSSAKKELWTTMLGSVASGKRLPERNILVLGGSPETQQDFIEGLAAEDGRRTHERSGVKQPPVANSFALGYTFLDVLDAEHEDVVARLSLYLLSDPSTSFSPLLQSLFNAQSIPNTLVTVLLDWSEPWLWLRQLRDWIRLLRASLASLDQQCGEKMSELMLSWKDRGRGTHSLDGESNTSALGGDVSLPRGPGEWDEALGLPLCVVCQNASIRSDRIEALEKERGWGEAEFDFVLQTLRTVLLKHGASLIYTTSSVPSPLRTLIHSSLSISNLNKRQTLKHNVIDRDKVVVPPNWDSWGKIRVLREGFDVETVNKGWSLDIEEDREQQAPPATGETQSSAVAEQSRPRTSAIPTNGAVAQYESTIRDPHLDTFQAASKLGGNGGQSSVETVDSQKFLAGQLEILEKLKLEASEDKSGSGIDMGRLAKGRHPSHDAAGDADDAEDGRVHQHIGPVQFNMGGIQVDADDMLQRLKDRQAYSTPEPSTPTAREHVHLASPTSTATTGAGLAGNAIHGGSEGGEKRQNEALASFFSNLMSRKGTAGSATNSPRAGGGGAA